MCCVCREGAAVGVAWVMDGAVSDGGAVGVAQLMGAAVGVAWVLWVMGCGAGNGSCCG